MHPPFAHFSVVGGKYWMRFQLVWRVTTFATYGELLQRLDRLSEKKRSEKKKKKVERTYSSFFICASAICILTLNYSSSFLLRSSNLMATVATLGNDCH